MHKIIVLTLAFMGSVYGMDTGAGQNQQGQQPGYLEDLRQDPDTLVSNMPGDLFPIIEGYRVTTPQRIEKAHQDLQKKLNQAKSFDEKIALGKADKDFKVAPLKFELYNNPDVNDDALKEIAHLFSNITWLVIEEAKITEEGLKHVGILTNLKHLFLHGNHITDAGLVHLKGLANLKELDLSETLITDAGLVHLKSLVNLKTLYLFDTQITSAGLEHLKSLTNLTYLSLSKGQVTDEALRDLQQALPNCKVTVVQYK